MAHRSGAVNALLNEALLFVGEFSSDDQTSAVFHKNVASAQNWFYVGPGGRLHLWCLM